MQIVIDIPKEVKEVFDKAKEDDLNGSYYDYNSIIGKAIQNGTPLPKCNRCKYYEGVHNVQGHAPCEYHKIGGVLWNWYCSQFEVADKEIENDD